MTVLSTRRRQCQCQCHTALTIATDIGGYQQLLGWAAEFGQIIAFGIEGTGTYGAGCPHSSSVTDTVSSR